MQKIYVATTRCQYDAKRGKIWHHETSGCKHLAYQVSHGMLSGLVRCIDVAVHVQQACKGMPNQR